MWPYLQNGPPDRNGDSNKIGKHLQVFVRDNNVEQALKVLKRKMQREGVFREMKRRKAYEKPSERKTREKAEAIRRVRKAARKQAQRDGLIPMPKRREDVRRSVARPMCSVFLPVSIPIVWTAATTVLQGMVVRSSCSSKTPKQTL